MEEQKDAIELLTELAEQYADAKGHEKATKKVIAEKSAQIKKVMTDKGLNEFTANGVRLSFSETKTQSFDEDKLIAILRGKGIKGIIKRKEYVDMQALEDAIYKEKVEAVDLVSAQVTKVTETLRVTDKREK